MSQLSLPAFGGPIAFIVLRGLIKNGDDSALTRNDDDKGGLTNSNVDLAPEM